MIRYNASVHLTIHMQVGGPSPEEASATVRDMVSQRPGFQDIDISGIVVRPMSTSELLHVDNLITWQETEAVRIGTSDQRERYIAGLLPDEELCRIARDALFVPFGDFALRKKMTVAAIGHPRRPDSQVWRCVAPDMTEGPSLPIPIVWSTMPSSVLSPPEWRTLTEMNRAVNEVNRHPWLVDAPAGATLSTRVHRGVCQRCQREAEQTAALVTIAWAGRTLSREYAL